MSPGSLYLTFNASWVMVTWEPPPPCEQNDRQTDTTETDMLFLFPRLQFGCGHDFVGKIHFLIITESFIS